MGGGATTTPICRCRVLYLGSAVPCATKEGLAGIQEPLRELYPAEGGVSSGGGGIDSWLSVWSNGLLLENVDEGGRRVTRFFAIDALHYCAAVRRVLVPHASGPRQADKFLPLDSPFARFAEAGHPPLFACILRRTSGIKVLECHAFVCRREAAANALVRCCFHAYADCVRARECEGSGAPLEGRRALSLTGLDRVEGWRAPPAARNGGTNGGLSSDDDNYKVWSGVDPVYAEAGGTLRSSPPSQGGTLRAARARIRQMAGVSRPPPPPSPIATTPRKSAKPAKNKKKDKSKEMNGRTNGYGPPHRPMSVIGHYAPLPPPPLRNGYYTERRAPRGGRLPLPGGYGEEPLYVAAGRPLSPLSAYPPPHFAPFEQLYGTAPRPLPVRRGPPPPHLYRPPQRPPPPERDDETEGSGDGGSPFGTGLLPRRKGPHLNERAFSASIRAEHRSRSGSLASLLDPPPADRDQHRAERELAQLVGGLQLADAGGSGHDNFIRKKPQHA